MFVLQRRVKTLQDKVETQKSKIKELEGELQTRIAREQKFLSHSSKHKPRDLPSASHDTNPSDDKGTMTTALPDVPGATATSVDRTVRSLTFSKCFLIPL